MGGKARRRARHRSHYGNTWLKESRGSPAGGVSAGGLIGTAKGVYCTVRATSAPCGTSSAGTTRQSAPGGLASGP